MMLWTGNDNHGLLFDVLAENSYLDEKRIAKLLQPKLNSHHSKGFEIQGGKRNNCEALTA